MCVCPYIEVKQEEDPGDQSTDQCPSTPKHMGENVHVFECLTDYDTKVPSKVGIHVQYMCLCVLKCLLLYSM